MVSRLKLDRTESLEDIAEQEEYSRPDVHNATFQEQSGFNHDDFPDYSHHEKRSSRDEMRPRIDWEVKPEQIFNSISPPEPRQNELTVALESDLTRPPSMYKAPRPAPAPPAKVATMSEPAVVMKSDTADDCQFKTLESESFHEPERSTIEVMERSQDRSIVHNENIPEPFEERDSSAIKIDLITKKAQQTVANPQPTNEFVNNSRNQIRIDEHIQNVFTSENSED